jgi:hypothetical protein
MNKKLTSKDTKPSDKSDKQSLFVNFVSRRRVWNEGKNTIYDLQERNMNSNNKAVSDFVYSDLTLDTDGLSAGMLFSYMQGSSREINKTKCTGPNLLVLAGTLVVDKKETFNQTPKLFKIIRATGKLIAHEVSGDGFDNVKVGDTFTLEINEIEENKLKRLQWTIYKC